MLCILLVTLCLKVKVKEYLLQIGFRVLRVNEHVNVLHEINVYKRKDIC